MALIWHGKKVQWKILTWTRKRIIEAALLYETAIKQLMKKGGRTESGFAELKPGTKRTMVDAKSGAKVKKVGSFRSAPGEVPRVQTGRLRRSITSWFHPKFAIARVGTNVKYGKWLEIGTRKMKPRPFMRPALALVRNKIKALFQKGLS